MFSGVMRRFVQEDDTPEMLLGFVQQAKGIVVRSRALAIKPVPASRKQAPAPAGDHGGFAMQIRKEQMATLDKAAWEDFYLRLAEFLRTEMPDQTADLSDAELSEFVRGAHARSLGHGIGSEAGVAQYACLSLEAGPNFADNPDIAALLHEPGSDPEEQLDALVDMLADKEELEELIPYAVEAADGEMLRDLRAELEDESEEE